MQLSGNLLTIRAERKQQVEKKEDTRRLPAHLRGVNLNRQRRSRVPGRALWESSAETTDLFTRQSDPRNARPIPTLI
jgi:hypothetical protein